MTTSLIHRDPFRRPSPLQNEMRRMLAQLLGGGGERHPTEAGSWTPAVDVEEDDEAFTIHAELPGVTPEDVEVTLEDDVLTIDGERRFYEEREQDDFRRIERRYGRFHRALRLPAHVDAEAVEARAREGLLEITVPKTEQTRPRRIEIASG